MGLRVVTLFASVVLVASCRDVPAPFDADDRTPPSGTTARLTYSAGDEHGPSWLPDASRIVYSTRGFSPYPEIDGVLLSVDVNGSAALPVLPEVQLNSLNPGTLTAPAIRPDGAAIAYLRIASIISQAVCATDVGVTCDGPFPTLTPTLRRAELAVRELGVAGPVPAAQAVAVSPVGFFADASRPVGGNTPTRVFRDTPFQRQFRGGIPQAGPDWSPDGDRLVFSDGSGLFLWAPGEAPVPIPGTEWGLAPAWSPDGTWIAFSREAPTDSTITRCTQSAIFGVFCAIEATLYTTPLPTVELVRPDGSETRVLTSGIEPAWSHDGARVFYADSMGIRSIRLDGSGDTGVPAAEGGREPAPSPDGRWLAFTRRGQDGSFDLWRTELTP